MSLLMDALKRAEKARQAEDERKRNEAEAGGDSQELTLEAISENPAATGARAATGETRAPSPRPDSGLSVQDTGGGGDSLVDSDELRAVQAEILSGKASLDATLEDTDSWDLSELHAEQGAASEPQQSTGELNDSAERPLDHGGLPLDETNATLPSMRAAQRSVDDYFDGTHSMSMSADDVRDGSSVPDPGDTDGRVHPDTTRRTARALLDGDLPGRTQRTGVIAALVLIPLLLVVVGGGAYLFKDEIMRFVDGPQPPLVRRTAPAPREPAQTTTAADSVPAAGTTTTSAATAAMTAPTTPDASTASGSATPGAQPSGDEQAAFVAAAKALAGDDAASTTATLGADATSSAADSASSSSATVVAGTIDTGVGTAPRDSSASATIAQASPSSLATSDVAVGDVLRDAGPDSMPAVAAVDLDGALASGRGSPSLKITRRRGPGRIARLIRSGYDAYQAGDDSAAARAYQRVLRARPNNRDALLGMAAIYMRANAVPEARATYATILKRNPRDPAAMAGLLAVDRSIDPTTSESQLKTLLADRPQDPGLHFALGNVYAGQLRWPEAQQEFFEAHRYQPDNPDYAFNLAVALDQLRQPKAAANFYQRALELNATGAGAAFDADGVRARLAELGQPG